MLKVLLTWLTLGLAASTSYDLKPKENAYIFVMVDGEMNGKLRRQVSTQAAMALARLSFLYQGTGYNLSLSFAYGTKYCVLSTPPTTSFWDFNQYAEYFDDHADYKGNKQDLSVASELWKAARTVERESARFGAEYRKVVVFFTDRADGFGTYNGELSFCERAEVGPEMFRKAFEDARAGLLHIIVAPKRSDGQSLEYKLQLLYPSTNLSDLLIAGTDLTEEYSFDVIDWDLAVMLSPEYVTSTSTSSSTASPVARITQCVKDVLAC